MIANRTTKDGRQRAEIYSRLSVLCRLSSVLRWPDVDIRRVGMLHADDVIAGVDMVDFAGDAARHVGERIGAGLPDFLDGDIAAQRRVILIPLQDIAEVADAGGGERLDRPRRDGVDADVLYAEVGGELAHRRFQSGF